MDEDLVEFYSQERWDNWLDRLEEADLDDEEETSRLYLNLQNDAAIAVAKVLRAHRDDRLDLDEAIDELEDIRDIVLADPELEDEESLMLIDAIQTSLLCVFVSIDRYLADEPAGVEDVTARIDAAVEAEEAENFDDALAHAAEIGAAIIEGERFDLSQCEDLEYGLVAEWLGGLDSLQEAMQGPKVVEE